MKKTFTVFSFLCLAALQASAQVFPVDTILYNGPNDNRVVLAILADGYTAAQQDTFIRDAKDITDKLLATSPYTNYKSYFNVYAVKVPSVQSGASHKGTSSDNACGSQPIATVNNYFKSSFDGGGSSYHRLLVIGDYVKVSSVLASNVPYYDQALVLVNTPYYGGSGGSYAVTSLDGSAPEIAIHEVGHSFAYLADEYWAGSQYATESKANMTQNSNPATVKWKAWIGTPKIGVFPHSGDATWFKPANGTCKMEYLGVPFCSVCQETHIETIHSLTKPYDGFTPGNKSAIPDSDPLKFDLTLVRPFPNTLKVVWELNDDTVAKNTSTYQIRKSSLVAGLNYLRAYIVDTTSLSRAVTHASSHVHFITWSINKSVTGFDLHAETSAARVSVFPNPSTGATSLELTLQEAGLVDISLSDLQGTTVYKASEAASAGNHRWHLPTETLPRGMYLVRVMKGGTKLWEEKLVLVD